MRTPATDRQQFPVNGAVIKCLLMDSGGSSAWSERGRSRDWLQVSPSRLQGWDAGLQSCSLETNAIFMNKVQNTILIQVLITSYCIVSLSVSWNFTRQQQRRGRDRKKGRKNEKMTYDDVSESNSQCQATWYLSQPAEAAGHLGARLLGDNSSALMKHHTYGMYCICVLEQWVIRVWFGSTYNNRARF